MKSDVLESQLSQFEDQLALLFVALVRDDGSELVAASAELQSMAVLFSKVMQQTGVGTTNQTGSLLRVKKIGVALSSLREGLLRRSVAVDRALAALIPAATQLDTYSPKSGIYARQPYGSAGRRSGELKVFTV